MSHLEDSLCAYPLELAIQKSDLFQSLYSKMSPHLRDLFHYTQRQRHPYYVFGSPISFDTQTPVRNLESPIHTTLLPLVQEPVQGFGVTYAQIL